MFFIISSKYSRVQSKLVTFRITSQLCEIISLCFQTKVDTQTEIITDPIQELLEKEH